MAGTSPAMTQERKWRDSEAKVFHSGDVVSCQSEPSWQDFVSMGVARGNASVRTVPTFDLEAELMDALHGPIVGIDEAGRGPWAGPVVVAAVILNPDRIPEGLNDSKVLTAEAREDRYAEIMATSCVSVIIGQVRRIDRDNILQATLVGHARRLSRATNAGGHGVDRRQHRAEAIPLQGARSCRRRRPLGLHRRGVDRGQGHPRPADGEARAPLPPLWLGVRTRATARPSMPAPSRSTACAPITAARSARSSLRSSCSTSLPKLA